MRDRYLKSYINILGQGISLVTKTKSGYKWLKVFIYTIYRQWSFICFIRFFIYEAVF